MLGADIFWANAGRGATVVLALLALFGRPILALRDRRRDQRKADLDLDLWMRGRPEIPGVAPALIPAPVEMVLMKRNIATLTIDVGEMKPVLAATVTSIAEVKTLVDEVRQIVGTVNYKITKNGENTNNIGDMVARVARVQGVLPDLDEDDSAGH